MIDSLGALAQPLRGFWFFVVIKFEVTIFLRYSLKWDATCNLVRINCFALTYLFLSFHSSQASLGVWIRLPPWHWPRSRRLPKCPRGTLWNIPSSLRCRNCASRRHDSLRWTRVRCCCLFLWKFICTLNIIYDRTDRRVNSRGVSSGQGQATNSSCWTG